MRKTRAAAAFVLAATACAAQAMSIREMRTLEANEKEGKVYASYYLVGVMEGLTEASDTETPSPIGSHTVKKRGSSASRRL